MAAIVQTFGSNALPSGFTKRGTVQFYKSFQWDRLAKNGSQVDPGVTTLPQTSDFFCLIDDPRHNGAGTRQFPGDDMANFYIDHHDGFYTRGCKGAELIWTGVSIPPGGIVHFHYIFLRGEFSTPFNAFGQFLAVDAGNQVVRKLTLSQSRQGQISLEGERSDRISGWVQRTSPLGRLERRDVQSERHQRERRSRQISVRASDRLYFDIDSLRAGSR